MNLTTKDNIFITNQLNDLQTTNQVQICNETKQESEDDGKSKLAPKNANRSLQSHLD